MFMNSYSQKYGVDYRARASGALGYEISVDGGLNWDVNYRDIMDRDDSLYVTNTWWWLASPGFEDAYSLFSANGENLRMSSTGDSGNGFRPLVCLKDDVELEKNSDGTYTIK